MAFWIMTDACCDLPFDYIQKQQRLHIVPMEGAALFRWFSLVYHKNKFLSEPLCHFIDAVCAAE